MGKVGKAIKKIDPFTARVVDPALGQAGLANITGNDGGKAEAAAKAAAAQVAATREAADVQAQAVREASNQQAASVRDQAAAAAMAQVASINQQAQAAQIAAAQAAAPQEGAPDVRLTIGDDDSDPRRRYQGTSAPSIGGTSGGVGIRI